MTGWAGLAEPEIDYLVDNGLSVQVTWVDVNRHWAIWINKYYRTSPAESESRTVYTGRFSREECPTGYQALMAGLSEYRRHA